MATRKLMSRKGVVLGMITYPDCWDTMLLQHDSVRFPIRQEVRFSAYTTSEMMQAQVGSLSRAYPDMNSVYLWDISLEEFEKQRDCSFSPSAAYLRSIVE